MNTKLTLIITIYKNSAQDIQNWVNFYIDNSKKIQMFFLIDFVDDSIKIIEENVDSKFIFKNEINKGQFWTVYDFLKMSIIKTPYIKVCDPDDLINYKEIKKIKFGKGDEIISLNVFRGKKITKNITLTLKIKSIFSKKRNWTSNFGNSYTILPTNKIVNDNFMDERIRINTSQDQLLGFIALANGSSVVKSKGKFYYYSIGVGETSFENIIKTLDDAIITFNVIKKLIRKSKLKKYSDWPNSYVWFEKKVDEFDKKFGYSTSAHEKLEILKRILIYDEN